MKHILRGELVEWEFPLDKVLAKNGPVRPLIEKFEAQLEPPVYGPDGRVLFKSGMHRGIQARKLQAELEARDPMAKAERELKAAEIEASERAMRSKWMEEDFHLETPNALERMGLAEKERNDVAGADESRPLMIATRDWLDGGKKFLVLGGVPGTGKTVAACWALYRECRETINCADREGPRWKTSLGRFRKASAISRMPYFHGADREARDAMERLRLVRFLVVDDLGVEMTSEGWMTTLYELVDERLRNGVRTIITTNLAGADFMKRYDDRIIRRLKDNGTFVGGKA